MVCVLAAGTALVLWIVPRAEPPVPVATVEPSHEAPWLTREAEAQVFGAHGALGPLFTGVELGGPPPTAAVRDRIAAFARANRIDIDFEVANDELAAIRFAVAFGGCCGYEGADVLALRLDRPRAEECCGCEKTWIDNWAVTSDDGSVHMRARVRINQLFVRWEPTATLPEVLERADRVLGETTAKLRAAAGDRWIDIELGKRARLEVPYRYPSVDWAFGGPPAADARDDLGFHLGLDHGRVREITVALREIDRELFLDATRERWGRPRSESESTATWWKADRVIVVTFDGWSATLSIRAR